MRVEIEKEKVSHCIPFLHAFERAFGVLVLSLVLFIDNKELDCRDSNWKELMVEFHSAHRIALDISVLLHNLYYSFA